MSSVVVRPCTILDIENAPNYAVLFQEYASELVVEGAPPFSVKWDVYHTLEDSGALQAIGAYLDNILVGFVTVLVSVFPHVGVLMAITESLFVSKEHRKSGAGLKLIRFAEKTASESGAPCLFISAPFGGDLAEVLPHIGYVETNRLFFRKMKNE